MGLGCLLLLCVAARGRADGEEAPERPAPQRVSGAIPAEPPARSRVLIPPYARSVREGVTTSALFPLYFERHGPALREVLVPGYYLKRSPQLKVDVALALIWSLRGPQQNTFVLPPFYTHRKGKDWGVGLLPLFSTGVFDGHHHTVIPPLLTWIDGDRTKRHTLIGPYFNFKKDDTRFWGLFPLVWGKRDPNEGFTVVPPLFWRFTETDPLHITTVVPPFYHLRRKEETSWGLAPLVFGSHAPKARSLTLPFLIFHYRRDKAERMVVTPLMSYVRDDEGTSWLTPVYQCKRGDRGYNAVTPFYFHTWDQRDMSSAKLVPPFFFHWNDPGNDTLAVFPFVYRTYHAGISRGWLTPLLGHFQTVENHKHTWWALPTIHYGRDDTGFQFNIHPLLYRKKTLDRSHFVLTPIVFDFHKKREQTHRRALFPLWWNFKNFKERKFSRVLFPVYWEFEKKKQGTRRAVGFPLYWDFRNDLAKARTTVAFPFYLRLERGPSVGHAVLNTYYERRSEPNHKSYQFHFFPFVSFGRGQRGTQTDRFWSLFYGLAGYERRGAYRRATLLWLFNFNLKPLDPKPR